MGVGLGLVSPDAGSSSVFCFGSRTLSGEAGLAESAGFSPEAFEEPFEDSGERCLPAEPDDELGEGDGPRSDFAAGVICNPGRKLLNNSFHLIERPITTPTPIKINNSRTSSSRLPARPTWLPLPNDRAFSGT